MWTSVGRDGCGGGSGGAARRAREGEAGSAGGGLVVWPVLVCWGMFAAEQRGASCEQSVAPLPPLRIRSAVRTASSPSLADPIHMCILSDQGGG